MTTTIIYRTWQREGYRVEERNYDYDLHCFAVVIDGYADQIIYPDCILDMELTIELLDASCGVYGWEDGNGNLINLYGDAGKREIELYHWNN